MCLIGITVGVIIVSTLVGMKSIALGMIVGRYSNAVCIKLVIVGITNRTVRYNSRYSRYNIYYRRYNSKYNTYNSKYNSNSAYSSRYNRYNSRYIRCNSRYRK